MMINKFSKFLSINESQSKKIRKWVDFSTFFDWYNKNRQLIADILDVDVSEIITEEELLTQSKELINLVINPQSLGNYGRDGVVDTTGFKAFPKLKNKIVHDILHNIYNADPKEFDKDMLDFTESEYIEELEVLFIEESFMKYFSNEMDYVNTDFIHQNVNRLASFLMMVIMRNDPDRIVEILNGDIEPYIEVYGKEYPIKDTPFENLYKMFPLIPIDPYGNEDAKIKNGDDFETWVANITAYGDAISYSDGGDRSQFPYSGFLGDKELDDLTKEDFKKFLDSTDLYYEDIDNLEGFKHDHYSLYHDLVISGNSMVTTLEEALGDDNSYEIIELDDLPKSIKDSEGYEEEMESTTQERILTCYKITDIGNVEYLHLLPSEGVRYIVEVSYPNSRNYHNSYLFYGLDGGDNDTNKSDTNYINTYDGLYNDNSGSIEVIGTEGLWEYWMEFYDDDIKSKIVDDHVDKDSYYNNSIDSNVDSLFYDDNAQSIARRYFRHNDVLVSNREIGVDKATVEKPDPYDREANIKYKDNQPFVPIKDTRFSDYKSMSKHLITDNALKLKKVFDIFRGWTIKNVDKLKSTHNKMKNLFSKDELSLLNNLEEKLKEHQTLRDSSLYKDIINNNGIYNLTMFGNKVLITDYIKEYEAYMDIFRKFGTDDVFAYIKRIPNITDIDFIKRNIYMFEDMFYKNDIETLKKKSELIEVFSKDIEFDLVFKTSEKKPFYITDSKFKDKQEFINAMEEGFLREYDIKLKVIPNSFDVQIKGGIVDDVLSNRKGKAGIYYRLITVDIEFKIV